MAGTSKYDVMISYNWGSKETVLKIRNNLEQNGVTCWIDEVHMSGSTIEAMGKAIDNCTVFLMCYSEKYSQSQNCKSEAEYAHTKHKTIFPCKMDGYFQPSGWLGVIVGSNYYYDFSGKYPFKSIMQKLLQDVQRHLQNVTGRDNSVAQNRENLYYNEFMAVAGAGRRAFEDLKKHY